MDIGTSTVGPLGFKTQAEIAETPAHEVTSRFRLELDDAIDQPETLRGAGLLRRLEGPEPRRERFADVVRS